MKKCYTIILLCLISASLKAQIFHWIGPSAGAGGAWNNGSNWSLSAGGPAAGDFPKDIADDAVFDQDALVNLSGVASFPLNSLRVVLNRTARLFTNTAIDLTVNSNTAGSEALRIDAGSVLRDSVDANVNFRIVFTAGSTGEINGDLFLTGNPAAVGTAGSSLVTTTGLGALLTVGNGGRIIHRPKSALIQSSTTTLIFASGSYLVFDRDGSQASPANYHPNSTIRITGNTNNATRPITTPTGTIGNLEYDCPGLLQQVGLALVNGTIQGSLRFLNTNNQLVAILQNPSPAMPPAAVTTNIGGNLEIGGNSFVTIGAEAKPFNLIVAGNYVQSGGILSLQHDPTTTFPTRLALGGNLTQSAGILTATSSATSAGSNLFIIEMNGSVPQTIFSALGTIDNVNHQVALRLNNPNHITLNSPLAVGRIDFVSGRLITSVANSATISNTDNNPIDINGASASSHVQGTLKRVTAQTSVYRFPVGKGGSFRFCEVIPATTAASEYSAEYFNAGHTDLSVALPLTGVANNEYWEISRLSGSSAAVRLTLNGAVPGAGPMDGVVVARYNGADWVNEKGATGTKIFPGNSTSGNCTSQSIASFSPFTFGFGPNSALPIKLQYFNVSKGSGFNTLQWKADCYSTQAVFELERSFDGKQFSKIETIIADQQRCLQPFDFRDNNAGQGTVYYRVRVVDVDGTAYYSRVVAIVGKNTGFEIVGIYPTLITTGQLKVNVAAGNSSKAEFYITNTAGQIVKKLRYNLMSGENILTISIPELAAGVYQLSGFNSEGQVRSFRFIKQ